jgi:hypothetical protein
VDTSRLAKELDLTTHLTNLDDFSKTNKREFDEWKTSLYYAVKNMPEANSLVDTYLEFIGEEYDARKIGKTGPKVDRDEMKKGTQTSRLISIQGFIDLFNAYG